MGLTHHAGGHSHGVLREGEGLGGSPRATDGIWLRAGIGKQLTQLRILASTVPIATRIISNDGFFL